MEKNLIIDSSHSEIGFKVKHLIFASTSSVYGNSVSPFSEKFKVDKRKAHLSNLIFSGQLTKVEALAELEQPIYPASIFEQDLQFVLKKLGYTEETFQNYLDAPAVAHQQYNMSLSLFDEYPVLKPFKILFNK